MVGFLTRSCHYENAVEHALRSAEIPFVAVSDVLRRPAGLGVKAFDYLVRPAGARPCIVDVKGRKCVSTGDRPPRRWNSWVTRYDLEGLSAWRREFGADFEAAFVFAFWIDVPESVKIDGESESPEPTCELFGGRSYEFWVVGLSDYLEHQTVRSQRWETVHLSAANFRRLAWPLSVWANQPKRMR